MSCISTNFSIQEKYICLFILSSRWKLASCWGDQHWRRRQMRSLRHFGFPGNRLREWGGGPNGAQASCPLGWERSAAVGAVREPSLHQDARAIAGEMSAPQRAGCPRSLSPQPWLEVWKVSLAVIAERERINSQSRLGRGQGYAVGAESRVLHQIVHARFPHFDVRVALWVELHVYTLIGGGQILAVLLNVNR